MKGECADKEEAPIIVSNHVSPFEPFYLVSKTMATPVQRIEDSRVPIIGAIQKAMQVGVLALIVAENSRIWSILSVSLWPNPPSPDERKSPNNIHGNNLLEYEYYYNHHCWNCYFYVEELFERTLNLARR